MQLILSGGGSGNQNTELYEYFSGLVNNDKPLLYIPLAMDEIDYSDCYKWISNELESFKIIDIDMITDIEQLAKVDLLEYSSVFIGGGNTYRLLKIFKELNTTKSLIHYLKNGGTILGGSAGAIIFGKDIDSCAFDDVNNCGLIDVKGYDMVKEYSILCHYDERRKGIEEFIEKYVMKGNAVIALPEETSLIANGESVRVIGQKPCKVYKGKNVRQVEVGGMI